MTEPLTIDGPILFIVVPLYLLFEFLILFLPLAILEAITGKEETTAT